MAEIPRKSERDLINQFNRALDKTGTIATIDSNTPEKVLFKEYNENKSPHDHKFILTQIGSVKQGSIIESLNSHWMSIAHAENYNTGYEKSLIRQVKFHFLHKQSERIIPCIIDTKIQDINSGQYISLSKGSFQITIPESEQNKEIKINDILFMANQKHKITGVDYSKIGLITLSSELDVFAHDEPHVWDALTLPEPEPEPPEEPEEPTDPPEEEPETLIMSIESVVAIEVDNGTQLETVKSQLPQTLEILTDDIQTLTVPIVWDNSEPTYDRFTAGLYIFKGYPTLPEGVGQTEPLTLAYADVTVKESGNLW